MKTNCSRFVRASSLGALIGFGVLSSGLLGFGLRTEPAWAVANPNVLPSLRCEFNEGKVIVVISPEGMVKSYAANSDFAPQAPAAYQLLSVELGARGIEKGRIYHFQTPAEKVKEDIFVGQQSGSDGVTELEYPFAAQFSSGSGACIGFPKGFVPRQVRGVADGDVLNIRSAANARSTVIASASNGDLMFVGATRKSNKGSVWAKVAVAVIPENDRGPIKTVVGWANTAFLTAKPDVKL
jgi:hypothetical protein